VTLTIPPYELHDTPPVTLQVPLLRQGKRLDPNAPAPTPGFTLAQGLL